jgi:hypothetical protein
MKQVAAVGGSRRGFRATRFMEVAASQQGLVESVGTRDGANVRETNAEIKGYR